MMSSDDDPRRHSRRDATSTLTKLATAAAVAYGTYRVANWAWQLWKEDNNQDDNVDPRQNYSGNAQTTWQNKRQRRARCREEATQALHDLLLAAVRPVIEDATNVREKTQQLKEVRAGRSGHNDTDDEKSRQHESNLWDDIQLRAVTRLVATLYAHDLLLVVLTVQTHLLGGKLFHDTHHLGSAVPDGYISERMKGYQSAHARLLKETFDHFFAHGLSMLLKTVEGAVSRVFASVHVMDACSLNMSLARFHYLLTQVMLEMEATNTVARKGTTTTAGKWLRNPLRYFMPPSAFIDTNNAAHDESTQSIMDETWDLLESSLVHEATRDCLQVSLQVLREEQLRPLFDDNRDGTPLAQVLPQLKKAARALYTTNGDEIETSHSRALVTLPSMLELGDVCFG